MLYEIVGRIYSMRGNNYLELAYILNDWRLFMGQIKVTKAPIEGLYIIEP